jgi:chemotaxis protein methyltransferase CheR
MLETQGSPYEGLLVRLRERAGLHLAGEPRVDIAGATRRAMRYAGIDSVEAYVVELDAGRVSLTPLLEEITVGETYFFREPEQFAFLGDVVLPSIVRRAPGGRTIRIWSAGCASGEEPYSLAILMTELGLAARTSIEGTDISERSLAKASNADYGAWSLRGPDAYRARRFLTATSEGLHLHEDIRRLVSFRKLNLAKDDSYRPSDAAAFDLILCRNVLIYLDADTIARIARHFFDSLAEGGWLILASSDPPLRGLAPFESVATERGVFYRKGTPDTVVSARRGPTLEEGASASPALPPGGGRAGRVARAANVRAKLELDALAPAAPLAPSSVASSVRALSNAGNLAGARAAAIAAIQKAPLDPEAHYLLAVVLIDLRRDLEAADVLRRVVYLDSKLIIAHLALGLALARLGERAPARLAFRTVRRLCAASARTALGAGRDGESPAYLDKIAETEEARLAEGGRWSS